MYSSNAERQNSGDGVFKSKSLRLYRETISKIGRREGIRTLLSSFGGITAILCRAPGFVYELYNAISPLNFILIHCSYYPNINLIRIAPCNNLRRNPSNVKRRQ